MNAERRVRHYLLNTAAHTTLPNDKSLVPTKPSPLGIGHSLKAIFWGTLQVSYAILAIALPIASTIITGLASNMLKVALKVNEASRRKAVKRKEKEIQDRNRALEEQNRQRNLELKGERRDKVIYVYQKELKLAFDEYFAKLKLDPNKNEIYFKHLHKNLLNIVADAVDELNIEGLDVEEVVENIIMMHKEQMEKIIKKVEQKNKVAPIVDDSAVYRDDIPALVSPKTSTPRLTDRFAKYRKMYKNDVADDYEGTFDEWMMENYPEEYGA